MVVLFPGPPMGDLSRWTKTVQRPCGLPKGKGTMIPYKVVLLQDLLPVAAAVPVSEL